MEIMPEKKMKFAYWIIGIVSACILIFLGIQNIDVVADAVVWCAGLVSPLILGFAFALILNVPMKFLERHFWSKAKNSVLQRLRRPAAFLVSLVLILGILAGVVWLVIPELVEAVKVIVQSVFDFVNRLSVMERSEIAALPFGNVLLEADWDKMLNSLQSWLKNQSGAIVNRAFGTIGSLVGGVFDFFVAVVFAIYILFSKDRLKEQGKRVIRAWLPKGFGEWLIHALAVASTSFRNFVSGQSLEAVIIGVLCMIGMLILRIPYAPMVSALVGVTALIPVMGAFVGTGVGAFMIMTVSPVKAVIFVIFILVLQQVEGNLIYPKVMGNRVNLPGMWILAAVTVGGGLAGAVGMLLSVPVASTVYVLGKEATVKREQRRSDLSETSADGEKKE